MSAPAIEGTVLELTHLGALVRYTDPHSGRSDLGVLSSWRVSDSGEPLIWVRFKGPNGERCDPERLTWMKGKVTE